MKIHFAAALLAATFTLPVQSATAQPPMERATREAVPYLAVAGEADVFEITSSQIALQRSRNPQVRAFATMLIEHHSNTTNGALTAAAQGGVAPPPPVLGARNRQMITDLLEAEGPAFDRVYLSQQLPAHQEALMLHEGYARSGDMPALRRAAQSAVPIVTRHLEHLRMMAPTRR